MRYWYDTEFIEDGETIDIVSIGVVAEDGREYYAQRADMDPSRASQWVRENVLADLLPCITYPAAPYVPTTPDWHFGWAVHRGQVGRINGKPAHCLEDICPWRTTYEIRSDLLAFLDPECHGKPELWGYYAAYDHVALCQLFGTMMDLPDGWPMYTRDITQWCDALGDPRLPEVGKGEHNALLDARWNRAAWEFLRDLEDMRASSR